VRRRGYALLLVLLVMSAASVAGAVFCTRLSVNFNARARDALRSQTLWLARSACSAQLTWRSTVKTAEGNAAVSRAGTVVSVELGRGTATVDCASHEERYRAD
jgi:type II secretory pathway component PulK